MVHVTQQFPLYSVLYGKNIFSLPPHICCSVGVFALGFFQGFVCYLYQVLVLIICLKIFYIIVTDFFFP